MKRGGSLARTLAMADMIAPRRITDEYLESLIHRVNMRFRRACAAPPEDRLAMKLYAVAMGRLRKALLQRERETAKHLGRCSRCGIRALRDVREWPEDMGGLKTGECLGCGSTISVLDPA